MGKRTVVVVATGMAVLLNSLAGCSLLPSSGGASTVPTHAVPSATPSVTHSSKPTTSPTTPSATPTAAAVKATGQLSFYKGNLVSKALVGTCAVVSGKPTITLADHKNDFYGTVDLLIVFSADAGQVLRIAGDFGEDSELITRKLTYPAKGASAQLVESGGQYRISGSAMLLEDGASTGDLIPYKLTATCASSDWFG